MRYRVLSENEITDQDTLEVEWPTKLESEMSEYDSYILLLADEDDSTDYFSSYCGIQRPEYHKIH